MACGMWGRQRHGGGEDGDGAWASSTDSYASSQIPFANILPRSTTSTCDLGSAHENKAVPLTPGARGPTDLTEDSDVSRFAGAADSRARVALFLGGTVLR